MQSHGKMLKFLLQKQISCKINLKVNKFSFISGNGINCFNFWHFMEQPRVNQYEQTKTNF